MSTDLRAPVLNWPVWPFHCHPLGSFPAGRYLLTRLARSAHPPEFQE
jgi:hypothetical protein